MNTKPRYSNKRKNTEDYLYDPRNTVDLNPKKITIKDILEKRTGNPVNPKYIQDFKNTEYITIFRQLSWLKDKVEQILVNPITLSKEFYDENRYKIYNDTKFYYVKIKYYQMRQKIINNFFVDEYDVVHAEYLKKNIEFQVGLYLKRRSEKIFIIQTSEMFDTEKEYVYKIQNSDIKLSDIKIAPISDELITIAKISINDYTPSEEYTNNIIKTFTENSYNSYDFAMKLSKLIAAIKFGNIFPKRLSKGYYNEDILSILDNETLFEGSDINEEQMMNYIEDSANNILLYSKKFNDIPLRHYQRNERKAPFVTSLDLRVKCENIDEVKDIPEENLAFYTIDNKFYCYDIYKLFFNFKNNNFINPYNNKPFSKEFISKIRNTYNFNRTKNNKRLKLDSFTDSDYDDVIEQIEKLNIKEDPEFLDILDIVRNEIENLNLSDEKCIQCKKKVGKMGLSTLDENGEIIKHCSKFCFEQ